MAVRVNVIYCVNVISQLIPVIAQYNSNFVFKIATQSLNVCQVL